MDIELTNQEILNLYDTLTRMNIIGNAKFTYVLAKNRAALKPHVDALQEAGQNFIKNNPEMQDYQKKTDELLKQFAVDKDGKPVTRQSGDGSTLMRVIPADKQAAYVAAREALDREYDGVLKAAQLAQDEFAGLLREKATVSLRPLALSDIPEDRVSTQMMNLIFIFVDDGKAPVVPLHKEK